MTLCVDRPLLFTRCENRQWCVCGRACTFKLVERLLSVISPLPKPCSKPCPPYRNPCKKGLPCTSHGVVGIFPQRRSLHISGVVQKYLRGRKDYNMHLKSTTTLPVSHRSNDNENEYNIEASRGLHRLSMQASHWNLLSIHVLDEHITEQQCSCLRVS